MKNIDLTKSENLLKLKEELNNLLESKATAAYLDECINGIDTLPLGTVKNLFESVSDKLYDTESGKKIIAKYVKSIKENKDLRMAYSICEAIAHPSYVNNSDLFVHEIMNTSSSINRKHLQEGQKNLANVVKNALKESKITAKEIEEVINSNKQLNETIESLTGVKRTFGSLPAYVNNLSYLSECVNKNMKEEVDENVKSPKELMGELDSLLSEDLNEWEKRVIADIIESQLNNGANKQSIFEQYKAECLTNIDNLINEGKNVEEKAHLSTMKQQLEAKNYSEDTILEDLLNLSKLSSTLLK